MTTLGIEELIAAPPRSFIGKRLALLCNQASTDSRFRHSRDLIMQAFPGQLVCLFSPQHGFFSEKQDNMIESGHGRDLTTGLPVFSLYGETREPSAAMFECFDILLIDLQDVGTRVYTFIWTVVYCLRQAAASGKKVVVLDRPNPIGGRLEGNLLRTELRSFVGLHEIPMRHGLTMGELALLCNRDGIHADLDVIKMQGWTRSMFFAETGLPWVFPSPNMPTPLTALVYPGQVLWEGTNVSEGRGTTLPFELVGAPFIRPQDVLERLCRTELPGCVLRPIIFEPTSGKWAGQSCAGFHIHVTEPSCFLSYRLSLALLEALLHVCPQDFAWKQPPYEYEYEKLPIDLILGDRAVREAVENGADMIGLERSWQEELAAFDARRRAVFLYPER
ncbi:exo-beta-N-acetylmuramidase NamZ domain-containing protein [Candidatus Electronema sp. JC]|uniref:exo-beta-N-acetylmuramidase NamZ family protein n=1 Tax=Candidatus Electronema sp. JC TaxID=3401570 RepID=UPI003AA84C33